MDNNIWFSKPTRSSNPQIRLFCFHYAGGSANIFRKWANLLPSTIELYPVELPGRWSRIKEKKFTDIHPLIKELSLVLKDYIEKPYIFFGHSLGALVSFELTRYFQKEDLQLPIHLFVSSRKSPHLKTIPIHHLPEEEFIIALNKRYPPLPKEILEDEESKKMFLEILRSDLAINDSYIYEEGPKLNVPITAIGGTQDKGISETEIKLWRDHTTAFFETHFFEGDHLFLNTKEKEIIKIIMSAVGSYFEFTNMKDKIHPLTPSRQTLQI